MSDQTIVWKHNPEVELISVIRTELLRRGEGTKEDVIRIITQYWSTDGELLAEIDPMDIKSNR